VLLARLVIRIYYSVLENSRDELQESIIKKLEFSLRTKKTIMTLIWF